MDLPEPSSLQPVAGLLLLAGLFVLRELVSGAMREIGKDLWTRVKERRLADQAVSAANDGAARACDQAQVSRRLPATGPRSRLRGKHDG